MLLLSAEANTSAGAPWVNWVTRSDDPAKENSMSAPGLSVLNCSPISVNDFFSDAAAKTISFPPAAALVGDGDDASFGEAWVDEPQPLITHINRAAAAAIRPICITMVLPGFRRSR